jgi:hypothetical protein
MPCLTLADMHNIHTEVNSPLHEKHELSKHPGKSSTGWVHENFLHRFILPQTLAELNSHSSLSLLHTTPQYKCLNFSFLCHLFSKLSIVCVCVCVCVHACTGTWGLIPFFLLASSDLFWMEEEHCIVQPTSASISALCVHVYSHASWVLEDYCS